MEAKSSIYLELLGSGILYSVNYEYFIKDDMPLRTGVGRWSFETFFFEDVHTTIPLTFSILKGEGNHKLELGGGCLFHRIYSEVEPLSIGSPSDSILNKFREHEVYLLGYLLGVVGYRYQKSKRGILFRLTYTPAVSTILDVPNQLIWFGLSAGYIF